MGIDLRQFVYKLLELAKDNLRQDGELISVAFLVYEASMDLVETRFENQEQKEGAYRDLVEQARKKNALAIVTLNDTRWKRDPKGLQEYIEGYYPGRLAAEGAREAILVTISGPTITTWRVLLPYERTPNGIAFGDAEETLGGELGFLSGWACTEPKPPA